MYIAHVQGGLSPEHGGPTHSLSGYCRAQSRVGHRVALWTLDGYPGVSPAVRLPPPVEMHVNRVEFPAKLARSGRMRRELLASDPADVYHLHGAWTLAPYYGAVKARRAGRPFLIELAGAYEPYAMGQKWLRKALVRRWFQDRMLHESHCLHVNSVKEADFLRASGFRTPIAVLPPGVDTGAIGPRLAAAAPPHPDLAGRPFLLFLARVHRNKGIELLVEAWAALAARFPDWLLAVAGPGDPAYEARCRQAAADRGVGDRCRWLGQVSEAAKTWLYANCGVYVLPTYSENFGNTVAEAMAHGVPVLTTRNTPWGEMPEFPYGWITDPSVASLTPALERAMALDAGERTAIGERARAYAADRCSLDYVADELVRTYRWARGEGDRPG